MKKKYTILLILVILCVFQKLKAQQTIDSGTGRAQNVFVEVLGQGLLFTANYDTRFSNKRNGIGGRIGIGYFASDGDRATTIPVGLNYLLGDGKNLFEVGLGATYVSGTTTVFDESDSGSGVVGTMSFSYRIQPINSGVSFRVGITPVFSSNYFIPYFFGLSLGYTFSGKHK